MTLCMSPTEDDGLFRLYTIYNRATLLVRRGERMGKINKTIKEIFV